MSKWNKIRNIPFYITYDYGDDVEHYDYTMLGNPTTYTIDTPDITLKTPTKNGYTFKGWTEGNDETLKTTVKIPKGSTGDKTFTAHWTPISYTITYNLNGGKVSTSNPTTYTIESKTITLVNPTKNGYTFEGWTEGNGTTKQTIVEIPNGSTGNKTFTAHWSGNSYEITLNLNGGTVNNPPTNYYSNESVTLPTPTKPGYTFAGWTGSNGATKQTTVVVSGTGNKTYNANWTIVDYNIDYK